MVPYKYVAVPVQVLDDPDLQPIDLDILTCMLAWTRFGSGRLNTASVARRARCPESQVLATIERFKRIGILTVGEETTTKYGEPVLACEFRFNDDRSELRRARTPAGGSQCKPQSA